MRTLSKAEQHKRGCRYCLLVSSEGKGTAKFLVCPADRCPFRELDRFNSYTDYLKSYGAQTLKSILMTIGMGKITKRKDVIL